MADDVRPERAEVVAHLKRLAIRPVMLTDGLASSPFDRPSAYGSGNLKPAVGAANFAPIE